MQREQQTPNPDVNTFNPDIDPGEQSTTGNEDPSANTYVERRRDEDVIPIPPDAEPRQPIEDPPYGVDAPVGDVDDSPKRIA